jgi:dissimilatory sulfite reductase (desulfoviridin) alpha/beta subunit
MKWTEEANEAISKVPFFVRKRVKKRVEEEALRCEAKEVRLEHVKTCQRRFLTQMEDEVKGYQVETCFGATGCPNRAVFWEDLIEKIEGRMAGRNFKSFLKERVQGPLKLHHEFRVSISDCPNACSRPQIVDLGLIGARKPKVSDVACNQCGACVEVCREGAISLTGQAPVVDPGRCLFCGQCIPVCSTGTLQEAARGYRILVGGKLGRHPRLAAELPGINSLEESLRMIDCCLDHYQKYCAHGERFGEILERTGGKELINRTKTEERGPKMNGPDRRQQTED